MGRSAVLTRILRRCRDVAGAPSHYPVNVVDGAQPPTMKGTSYHWRTPGGEICYSPNAYRRKFGKPIYHASTHRVEVGEMWLRELLVLGLDCPDEVVTDYVSELV